MLPGPPTEGGTGKKGAFLMQNPVEHRGGATLPPLEETSESPPGPKKSIVMEGWTAAGARPVTGPSQWASGPME